MAREELAKKRGAQRPTLEPRTFGNCIDIAGASGQPFLGLMTVPFRNARSA